ncbi:MAG TPA: PspC domain-containing protein [Candidatus Hydrogenedentes bacterium]|nr:PspC domain-containing protein [Candidatus Hydrogenedentota bacterium]HOL76477.1 PspC domain-containing protein [Candidatus Hydrogenedentota bacterium]HPO85141.1 PspC domain-containing protein [Candidatus Hydrogenedentota bacterium]
MDTLLPHRIYRSRHGVVFGVCRGIAEYFGFSVFGVRAITLILLFWTGVLPVLSLYLVAALLLRLEPSDPPQELLKILHRFKNLEERISYLEHKMGVAIDYPSTRD